MGAPVIFDSNGSDISLDDQGGEPLLFALRNRLNLKATHFGCGWSSAAHAWSTSMGRRICLHFSVSALAVRM